MTGHTKSSPSDDDSPRKQLLFISITVKVHADFNVKQKPNNGAQL